MLGIDNQDFAFFSDLLDDLILISRKFIAFFVIDDFVRGDLLSDIWLFTLKGLLMLRCSYNW